jgi:hypothetical protein
LQLAFSRHRDQHRTEIQTAALRRRRVVEVVDVEWAVVNGFGLSRVLLSGRLDRQGVARTGRWAAFGPVLTECHYRRHSS